MIDDQDGAATEATAIEAGERVRAFLADAAIKDAFVRLERRYFAQFKAAASPEEREALHARTAALDDLFAACLGIVDDGRIAQHTREKREEREKQEAARRTPRTR